MADLTAPRPYETKGPTVRIQGTAKASSTFYRGGLLVWDGGDLANPTNAAGKMPAGIFTGTGVDAIAGDTGLTTPASPLQTVDAENGLIWVPFSGAAKTDIGVVFYLADSATVTKTAGSKTIGVVCVGFKTGYVLLDFRNPVGLG